MSKPETLSMSCFSLDWRAVSIIDWWARQCGLKFTASTGGWPGFVYTGGKQGRGNVLNYWQLFNCGKGFKDELRSLHSLHLFGLFCLQNYSIVKSKFKGQAYHESGWTLSSVYAPALGSHSHRTLRNERETWPCGFRTFDFFWSPNKNNNFLLLLFLTQEK